MCDELEILEFIEYDAARTNIAKRRRRPHCNAFDLKEEEFVKKYRLSKDLVRKLCEDLRPYVPVKSTALSLETKVLIALSYYATGSYKNSIISHSITRPMARAVIRQITKLLNLPQLQAKYIKFPRTPQEREANVAKFFKKFGMPGVVGCIDCTFVAIVPPTRNEERYLCKKLYHSLNVQLICNADMEIISVDASHGGATHESFIWNNHPLKEHLEKITLDENLWLLGDSAYPLRRYLLTPHTKSDPDTPKGNYNEIHKRTRNIIDRTTSLLKSQFKCLHVNRPLNYTPEIAASIVNACVLLHNMCVQSQSIVNEVQYDMKDLTQLSQSRDGDLDEGLMVRKTLVNQLWKVKDVLCK